MSDPLYKPGTAVSIKGSGMTGTTSAVSANGPNNDNIEYCVIWWANSERRKDWLHDFEIEPHSPPKQAGFKQYPKQNKPLIDKP